MMLSIPLLLPLSILCSASHPSISAPSQQEFDAALTLSNAGLLTRLEWLELYPHISFTEVPPTELAILLSISEGFELSGVELTGDQWREIAVRSRRKDWAPKIFSLEEMGEMKEIWGNGSLP